MRRGNSKRQESGDESGKYSSSRGDRATNSFIGEKTVVRFNRSRKAIDVAADDEGGEAPALFSPREIDRPLFGSPNFRFLSDVASFFRAVESRMLERWLKAGDNARGSFVWVGKTVITSHFLSASTSYSALSAATITAISTMRSYLFFFSFHYTGPTAVVPGASCAPSE